MPTLPEMLNQIRFITYETALLGLFITAGAILIVRDWRFLILALLTQYILEGLILFRLVRPDIAVLNVLIGAFICPILFLSARQVSAYTFSVSTFSGRRLDEKQKLLARWWRHLFSKTLIRDMTRPRRSAATGGIFRIFIGLIMMLVVVTFSKTFPLPNLASSVTTAVYWLVLVGLTILILTEDPLKAGHGLLTTLSGFGLFYATLENSLLLTGLWGTVNLLIALAIGYLTVVKGINLEEDI
jgi:hypothetical protein